MLAGDLDLHQREPGVGRVVDDPAPEGDGAAVGGLRQQGQREQDQQPVAEAYR